MASKIDLISSPFNDYEFVYVSNDIVLYKIVSFDEYLKLHPGSVVDFPCEPISYINKYQNAKIVSWYPGHRHEYLIALHEINTNKIRLLNLLSYNSSVESILDLEKLRNCRALQWNQTKYLASGFESISNMKSIYIWDISQQNTKPLFELDECESCYSLAWSPDNSDLLFAGTVYQYISMYDLRKGLKPVESINSEYFCGFTIDPKDSRYAASFYENKFAVWDLRNFKEPVSNNIFQTNIKKIQFSPSKKHRLTVLTEKATELELYKICNIDENICVEPIYYNRRAHNESIINSFCWLPKDSDQIVTIDNRSSFNVFTMSDYVSLSFSPDNLLSVSSFINKANICEYEYNAKNDVEIDGKMKERALKNYGVQEFLKNADLITIENKKELDVKYLWQWLDLSNKICEKTENSSEKYNGIRAILNAGKENESILFSNFIENNRNFMLKLCGWGQWKTLVEELTENCDFERAACISIFNNDFDKAIEILTIASKHDKTNSNEFLALSLSLIHLKNNFNENPDEHKDLLTIVNKLTNSYLKILFFKLINMNLLNTFNYNETNILIPDRVAFAILTYNPEQLIIFINQLTSECIKQGNLYGILLTGLNSECIDLFQSYIHRTNDVQTAAVAIINSSIQNDNANMWIETYRELLDQWMLWEQRALFDIFQNNNTRAQTKPQLFIKCGYCGENISTKKKTKNVRIADRHLFVSNMSMRCQGCQKPLSRCVVCSYYMNFDPPRSAITPETDKMSYAFVFCVMCNHGGHYIHLNNWFKEHNECPVMNCLCCCGTQLQSK